MDRLCSKWKVRVTVTGQSRHFPFLRHLLYGIADPRAPRPRYFLFSETKYFSFPWEDLLRSFDETCWNTRTDYATRPFRKPSSIPERQFHHITVLRLNNAIASTIIEYRYTYVSGCENRMKWKKNFDPESKNFSIKNSIYIVLKNAIRSLREQITRASKFEVAVAPTRLISSIFFFSVSIFIFDRDVQFRNSIKNDF